MLPPGPCRASNARGDTSPPSCVSEKVGALGQGAEAVWSPGQGQAWLFHRCQASCDQTLILVPLSSHLSKHQKTGLGKVGPFPLGLLEQQTGRFTGNSLAPSAHCRAPGPLDRKLGGVTAGHAQLNCVFYTGPRGERGLAGESFMGSSSSISELLSTRECPRVVWGEGTLGWEQDGRGL